MSWKAAVVCWVCLLSFFPRSIAHGVGKLNRMQSTPHLSLSLLFVPSGLICTLVVLCTNTMIDLGFVMAALVPLILSLANCSYEVIWRTSFAIGVIPRKYNETLSSDHLSKSSDY